MIARFAILPAAFAMLLGAQAPLAAQELDFASWGGAYQDAIRQAWIAPFTKETGIKVNEDTGPETAKIKAMVDTNSVSWDVVTGGGAGLMLGVKQGLFEKLSGLVDESHAFPNARNDYGAPSEIFSTLIGFSTKAFPATGPQPQTFADFWDVKRFPGKRTLPNNPDTVLEAALLADGVPADQVYATLSTPEGMTRAIAKVRALKADVAIWWSNGAQPVQALGSGDVVMALGWNGRFQAGIDQGLPIAMAWGQSVAQVGYFMMVKGAPHRDAAIKFLNFIETAQAQSRFSQYFAYGPVTPEAMPMIDAARAARLPTTPDRIKAALFEDIAWWAAHGQAANEAYTAMMQGN
jgi:putative spermidine/putrescine transport system substrate-binding protein